MLTTGFYGTLISAEGSLFGIRIKLQDEDSKTTELEVICTNEEVRPVLLEQILLAVGEKVLLNGVEHRVRGEWQLDLVHMSVLRTGFMLKVQQEALARKFERRKNILLNPCRGLDAIREWFERISLGLQFDEAESVTIGDIYFPVEKKGNIREVTIKMESPKGEVSIRISALIDGDAFMRAITVEKITTFVVARLGDADVNLGDVYNGNFTWSLEGTQFLRNCFESEEAKIRRMADTEPFNILTDTDMVRDAIIVAAAEQVLGTTEN